MKFVGLALEGHREWEYYYLFLDPGNHLKNISIDVISFHFYGSPSSRTDVRSYEELFDQADGFFPEVKQILHIRNLLNPNVRLDIDELGIEIYEKLF